MTLEDSIHSQRLRVLRDAERLRNVSEACRRHGVSRTLFYRLRQRLEEHEAAAGSASVPSRWRGRRAGRSGIATSSRVTAWRSRP